MFGLDLMRAFAILLVVTHHGFDIFSFPFIPLPDGVDIFFVLSGFLIGRILFRAIINKQTFSQRDIKLFLFRRWFRTLPALWFTLIVNLVITFFINFGHISGKPSLHQMFLKDGLWEYIFFLQNLFRNLKSGFFPESWSLSVEEWFYVLLPMLLFAFLKLKLDKRRSILAAIFIMIILPTIARYFLSNIHAPGTWMGTRMIVIMRLDSIGFGVLLAYLYIFESAIWIRWANSRFLMAIGIVSFYASFLIVHEGFLYFHSTTFTNLFFFPITSICVMVFLPGVSNLITEVGIFGRGITLISKISYSMYLVNYSIVIRLMEKLFQPAIHNEIRPALYLSYWLCTIFLAILMHHYIEMPFLMLRDKHFGESQIPISVNQRED